MILAAGLGTRLRPLTYLMPKPMAPVLNAPVMEHGLRLLARNGFTEVVANVSYLPEQIEGHFGDGSGLGVELSISREERPLGTAGGVRKAAEFLVETDSFLIISGDALTDIDLATMREAHLSHDGIATLATKRVADTSQFGVAITGEDGRIQGFQEKPDPAEALSDLANCGIYMFRREIFDHFPAEGESAAAGPDDPPGFVDWAMDVFPRLLDGDVPFYSHEIDAYWNDIGSIEEYVQGNADALDGAVAVDNPGAEVAQGVFAAEGADPRGAKVKPPLLIGAGCEIGGGADLHGPLVLGDGCRIGAGAMLRNAVVLPGAEVAAGAMIVGGVYGVEHDRPLG